jgi:hypothetical protein
MQYQVQLANETWESAYIDNDTNSTFLNIFEASFPVRYKNVCVCI